MMLRSVYRRYCFRSFTSEASLLPAIKKEASDSEVETNVSKAEAVRPKSDPRRPKVQADGSVHLFITQKGDVRKIAGRVANIVRDLDKDDPILLKATGINAVNNAVKTLHVARNYLLERPGIHIGFCVNHGEDSDKDRISRLQFMIRRIDPVSRDPNGLEEMWVKSVSKGRSLGGKFLLALQNAESALSIAIGPRSVGRMILGLTWARRMLHSRKLDAIAVPKMMSVSLNKAGEKKKFTAIQLTLLRVPYEPLPALDPDEPFDDNKDTSVIEDPMSK